METQNSTTDIEHFSRLRRHLAFEHAVNPEPVRFRNWLAVTFNCHVEVTEKISGLDANYRLFFDSPKKKLLFDMKYAEYL